MVFAFEQAIGYLVSDFVLDKDSFQAAVLLVDLANYYKVKYNLSLLEVYENIQKEYGYYIENDFSIVVKGLKDTAGRLHVDKKLMLELESICKLIDPLEIFYITDANIGQMALNIFEQFKEYVNVTGIIGTKMEGSLNVLNVMNKKNIRDVVSNAIDALTAVIQISDLTNAPGAKKAAEKLRAVGLGAMNLAAFFATNEINYESDEALDFVNIFFMMVNYYSLVRSNELARIHRSTF
ncbi:Ribonucleoside-diphosphate reductase subunit like protein [Argiope bruennichi]|uniref:Ribonucleoside-diphosphate reductase subunit like protein n=1 Tax=Argiope bruennichi TaxID=94029 RepID=A0A8T0F3W4_ARGBR|nr:Ribonucleoside-diphosphate reductase subunit like protein [Argiope bruennichi]